MSLYNQKKKTKGKPKKIANPKGSYEQLLEIISHGIDKSVKGLKFDPLDENGKLTGKLISGNEMSYLLEIRDRFKLTLHQEKLYFNLLENTNSLGRNITQESQTFQRALKLESKGLCSITYSGGGRAFIKAIRL